MYVIESKRDPQSGHAVYSCLHEASKSEYRGWLEQFATEPSREFEVVDSSYAHRWVRSGRLHNTGLYLDGNFIRKAKENS